METYYQIQEFIDVQWITLNTKYYHNKPLEILKQWRKDFPKVKFRLARVKVVIETEILED